jgi:diguanylate cyclase (GGDEF)-like protein/PAS domain S-box-containing protein
MRQPAAWTILIVGAVLSLFTWRSLTLDVEYAARGSFNAVVAEARSAVDSRLRGYQIVLHGLQGLFHGSAEVDRRAFGRYIESLRPARGAGQVRAFSYARRVTPAQKKAYESGVRRVYPQFLIKPPGERAEYMPIEFLEPFSGNEAGLGVDIVADAVRRGAVERARDTGTLIASAPFTLASSPGDAATSLRLAVYRGGAPLDRLESRRRAFAGVVSVTFRIRDIVEDIVSRHAARALQLRLVDAGERTPSTAPAASELLYDSASAALPGDALHATTLLEVGGRMWELQFSAPPAHFRTAVDALMPWLALLGGITITVLLAALVGSLTTSTRRARRIAETITQDLLMSQAKLADAQRRTQTLIETLPNPVFFKGTDGRYLGVNKAWEAFFNTPRAAIVGKTVQDLYTHAADVAQRLHAMDEVLWQNPGTQIYETIITLPDGTQRDTVYYKATFTGPEGSVAGLIGTIIDITERKQVEQRQAMEHAVTQVLAKAESLSEAAPEIIRTICETLGWACGAHWRWDEPAQVLRCAETWHVNAVEVAQFISATSVTINEAPAWHGDAPRTKTDGLVRRVWLDGAPVWFPDVTQESGFRRGPDAAKAGLHCAFGFPVMAGTQPLGVMEFFGRDIKQPDRALLSIARSIGSQIGQFIVRKQAEEALRFVATHDALTGLPNRVMFSQRLDHAIRRAQRHGQRLAVLFIDLDRFKEINDTLGHDYGDSLLREVARRLSQGLRSSDTVARLGGDEFVVLLEEIANPVLVAGVAQKLGAALAERFVLAGSEYHITASIGVSIYPDDSEDAPALLKNADIAMYRAKEPGGNMFQFYSPQLNLHTVEPAPSVRR